MAASKRGRTDKNERRGSDMSEDKPTGRFGLRNNKVRHYDDKAIMRHFGYELHETIGRGAYAKVKRGHANRTNMPVAIKVVDREKTPSEVRRKFLPREVKIAIGLKHDNIVRCYEALKARNKIYMVLELVDNGDLLKYVMKENFIVEEKAKGLMKAILSAVKYLHDMKIVHRDLKLENILLDQNLNPKLSDFGFARRVDTEKLSSTFCGSAAYAPLEILSGTSYDPFKVDIWSLGVILYSMTIGYMPFNDNKQIARMRLGVSFRNVKQEITKILRSLLCKILVNEPTERPIVDEILNDDWFRAGFADVCVAAIARQHKRQPVGLSESEVTVKKSRLEGSKSVG
eukprot:Seg4656.2 transcript_id=Seg4656.2/GoldUCD/mRNA.D3Y31 product="Testis-specific serine/threonine-protein kinase 1" protein_id=Seg4656.2/GoldUCD/D3Y31